MNTETVETLNRITRRFYDNSAYGFAVAHEAPRPGWGRVLDTLAPSIENLPDLSVLDLGCGNGRFAHFFRDYFKRPFSYLGLDASPTLVEFAAARVADIEGAICELFDFVEDPLEKLIPERTFALVLAFGVLHHIPAHSRRRSFLEQLCRRVAPGGALACSIWRAQHPEQAGQETLSWEEYNRRALEPVDVAQIETGDNLVAGRGSAARYCHFVDEAETAHLFSGLPMDQVDTFTADGRRAALNRYFLLRRAAKQKHDS
jgi:tRNA (uracil-5-)-methyltransferase TRM9